VPTSTPSAIKVLVDSSDLSQTACKDLLSVAVDLDVDALSMFTLELRSPGEEVNKTSWSDADLFAPGSTVEIKLGDISAVATVMKGEVTGMEFEASGEDGQRLTVRGYDKGHRQLRSTKARSFAAMSAGDIAKQIASDNSLTPSVTDTGVKHEYVLQDSESDFDFLRRLARPFGYVVYIDDATLYFGPRKFTASAAATLTRGSEITAFNLVLSTQGLPGEIIVKGWDNVKKAAISGSAAASKVTKMGTTLGLSAAESAFGAAQVTLVNVAVATADAAAAIALAKLEEVSLDYIQGEVTCIGSAALKPGIVVALDGLGKAFSGDYYVTAAKHTFYGSEGYKTILSVRRNAT
jgi:phage protein D